jgi:hypothetical protein
LRRFLSSRLLHFFLLGLVLYGSTARYDKYQQRFVTCLSQSELQVLAADWARSTGRVATSIELSRLADAALDDQRIVKEAMLQGLHKSDPVIIQRLLRDAEFLGFEGSAREKLDAVLAMDIAAGDEVIRRRLIQILQHNAANADDKIDASADQLQAIYTENINIGAVPARLSFEHIFFDVGKSDAKARAEFALQEKLFDASMGDVFLEGNQFFALSPNSLSSKFGHDFSVALNQKEAPMGEWFGPLQSAYGFHLVRLTQRQAAYRRPVAELGPELESIWQKKQQAQHWQDYLEDLRHQYRVECHAPN